MRLDTPTKRLSYRKAFAPKGAIVVRPKGVRAGTEIYLTELNGRAIALGFLGTSARPEFNCGFRSLGDRERYLAQWIANLRGAQASRTDQQERARAWRHSYRVGDILSASWGYDQTNVDFAEVIETTEHTVTVRAIAQELVPSIDHAPMAGYVVPVLGKYIGEPRKRRVTAPWNGTGDGHVADGHHHMSRWSGKPVYCSWYA
jgi:hypothetical protein